MLGRFLAYKAMDSAWRSATRRSRPGGSSAASPTETLRLIFAILSYAGIFFGGMASCMAGGIVMLSLGFALVWLIGPAVLMGIILLPDRWFEAKRPLREGYEETLGRRTTAQMVGVPIVMLLGIGTCIGGQPAFGTVVALGGSFLLFVAVVYVPVSWFGYRKVDTTHSELYKTTDVNAHRNESQLKCDYPRVSGVDTTQIRPDKTTPVDALQNESRPIRKHSRAIYFYDVVSGRGPSIHIRSVCPVCRKESFTAESISGIGWPRLTCECGAPYGTLLKKMPVEKTWVQYLLSDGQPGRLWRVPWTSLVGVRWDPRTRQDGSRVVDLISGLTPLKWSEDEKGDVLVIVPGEDAAVAILSAGPSGYVPVSTPSSPLMAHADYSGFVGKDVIIWPDADKLAVNRARGELIMRSPNYAVEAGRRLIAAGAARVRVVDISTVQKLTPPEGYAVGECLKFCISQNSDCAFSIGPCPKDGANAADIPPVKILGLLQGAMNFEEADRALAERISSLLLEETLDIGESRFSDGSARAQPETVELASERDMNEVAPRPHVVYFIREKTADGKCKVGITTSLQRRLRALQTGNPNQLEIAHTLEVDGRRIAERIEEAVLNSVRGAGAELLGEWFENAIVRWAWEAAQREYARKP